MLSPGRVGKSFRRTSGHLTLRPDSLEGRGRRTVTLKKERASDDHPG